jgi:hypothetical protein
VLPYLMVLQAETFAEIPLPLPLLVLAQSVQSMLVFTVMAFLGLRAAASVGLKVPLIRGWLGDAEKSEVPVKSLLLSLLGGFVLALGVAAIDPLFGLPVPDVAKPAIWKGALASLYGSIGEEVQLRLFLMSVLAWGLSKLGGKRADGSVKAWPIATAMVLAALLFGLGHLPTAFALWEPSVLVVARTVLLNAALGLPFGWLYWKYGLEHAIVAHFGADIALHVVVAGLS